jgi:hypothetical protein
MLLNVAAFIHSENITFIYFESSLPCTFATQDITVHTTQLTKSKGTNLILIPSDNSPAKLEVLNTTSFSFEAVFVSVNSDHLQCSYIYIYIYIYIYTHTHTHTHTHRHTHTHTHTDTHTHTHTTVLLNSATLVKTKPRALFLFYLTQNITKIIRRIISGAKIA